MLSRRKLLTGTAALAAFSSLSEKADATPNDPGFPGNGGIGGVTQDYLTVCNIPNMWLLGKATGTVPLIDFCNTGADQTHPDLAFTATYNAINNTSDITPTTAHGTRCIGICSATANNGVGICSVGQGTAVAIKGTTGGGSPTISVMDKAVSNILTNYSKGICLVSYQTVGSLPEKAGFNALIANGFLFVVAAGESAAPSNNLQPSFVGLPCLMVGGTTNADDRWNDGGVNQSQNSSNINIAAPSGCAANPFLTTDLVANGSYTSGFVGTSFSIEIVGDILRCCWDANPSLRASDILRIALDPDNSVATTGFSGQSSGPVRRIDAAKCISKALHYSSFSSYSLPSFP